MLLLQLLLLLLLFIVLRQGICNYVPETIRVIRVYSAAATLYLELTVQVMLLPIFFYVPVTVHRDKFPYNKTN
jgi:hypothetical protein